jgi:hypothetical protein
MSGEEMDRVLNQAIAAYRRGLPVVVLDEKGAVMHGREFLQNINAAGMSIEAFVIKGVPVELWNGSAWPEMLAAAHNVFFLKRTG